ncbi:MmcQ/YjbR family DNA-binding protein [Lentilactobacillus kefiri]|uniref:MmcQ protein n=2 Tax=Lentilactobacillus kefiri TaxID=33962 RepID=A0A8E1V2I6_LENKE|nr:MmcQ/YjbR family DNA-binding protein [Lentilactobacillus kefiri]KRL52530.1 MmcQ protein [Lentilactobacillus parakefiri DSM 10551]KRM53415.1 MmcQ protein [Lentilactobacillus kefiri DSM 20587 = JCM 5818]MCJ2162145.1 MmcQ/YjbR family DNA-binding protein [Lentilactobacillus kefiri]MCP9370142.1 MmcQ/YjbR family DNA-binding protein [Lentilactobacillus kefiri]MDM7493273.1 MmcQ/YjbR family DNA-binding protein [Lentilactobacillus kefiri]
MPVDEVMTYVLNKYHVRPEYLWKKYPSYAVLRHVDNRKWFGLVMQVRKQQLGLEGSGSEAIMDIKLDPKEVEFRQGTPGFLSAYHMNKNHWLAMRLEQLDFKQITDLIDESYQLTK